MTVKSSWRLISYSEELVDGQPVYFCSNGHPIKAERFEPAGHSFHSAALKLLGWEDESAVSDDREGTPEKVQAYTPSSDSYGGSKGKKKSANGEEQQDHYALLGLSHLRHLASEDEIRKAYREVALRFHPDKQASILLAEETEAAKLAKKEEIESHFKSIQEAYEVLNDPVKRRIYDSTDAFDDEIPTSCAPQDFFKVFGSAFMRNSRWSVNKPVPSLGDEKTPLKEVDSFYTFWYNFKSWREFPHADEYDLEEAESREEKRWMERQNAKLSEKARKEENARIRALVDNSYKRDSRILRRKEEEKAEKKKKKEAKFLAKKLEEEEAARAAEEERLRKEEEDRQAAEAALLQKKNKEKEKKLLRKERARLRTLCAPILSQRLLDLCEGDVEKLCTSLDIQKLKNICDKMEGKGVLEQAKILRNPSENDDDTPETSKQEDKLNTPENHSIRPNGIITSSSCQMMEKPWGREEIELLRKGMQKYPKGTSRRWEVIADHIGTGRSVEEIIKATKTVLLEKPDSGKAFDSFLEKRKPAQSIASPLTTGEEAQGLPVPEGGVANTNNKEEPANTTANNSNPNGTIAANGVVENGESPSSDHDEWSVVQTTALIRALKTFTKDTSQRWERVAAAVPGKTVNQCKKKFASLRGSFRNQKNTA